MPPPPQDTRPAGSRFYRHQKAPHGALPRRTPAFRHIVVKFRE